MILINFSHPLSPHQREDIALLRGGGTVRVVDVPAQFDMAGDLPAQIAALVGDVPLTQEEWQTSRLIVNLPGHSTAAALLLAELHGRMGHFPEVLLSRRAESSQEEPYLVEAILDLQEVRDQARGRRFDAG